jgi:uncharacterized protein YozE (UPF0346 family)
LFKMDAELNIKPLLVDRDDNQQVTSQENHQYNDSGLFEEKSEDFKEICELLEKEKLEFELQFNQVPQKLVKPKR